MMIIEGVAGIGKSRVLDAFAVKALDRNIRVVMIVLHMTHSNSSYYCLKNLLIDLLDLEMEKPHQEKEQYLFDTLTDELIVQDLALLNHLLHIKLPLSERHFEMNEAERKLALHNLVRRIVQVLAKVSGFMIFCIDDSHYMDTESWEFIRDLGESEHAMVLLALRSSHTLAAHHAIKALKHPTNIKISLLGMESRFIGPLACQLLAVCRIPKRLETVLQERSHGLPSWCEQLLYSMLYDGLLNIVPEDSIEEFDEPMTDPSSCFNVHKVNLSKIQAQKDKAGNSDSPMLNDGDGDSPTPSVVLSITTCLAESRPSDITENVAVWNQSVTSGGQAALQPSVTAENQVALKHPKTTDAQALSKESGTFENQAVSKKSITLEEKSLPKDLVTLEDTALSKLSVTAQYIAGSKLSMTPEDLVASYASKLSVSAGESLSTKVDLKRKKNLVCLFAEAFNMADIRLPDSIKGMIQARIDRMEEIDQMLVKTSSVLGQRFPRKMLVAILDKKIASERLNDALIRLAENGVFECGSRGPENLSQGHISNVKELEQRQSMVEKKYVYKCNCIHADGLANSVATCKMFRFQTATIQETAYEMYTENLRRQLHVRAAEFMEVQPLKCRSCGGPDILLSEQSSAPNHASDLDDIKEDPGILGESRIRRMSYKYSNTSAVFKPPADMIDPTNGLEKRTHDELAVALRQSLLEGKNATQSDVGRVLDMRECTCTLILTRIYPEMIRHWKCAGNVEKTVCALMEAASALLAIDDNTQAFAYLNRLSDMIVAIKRKENPFAKDHVNHVEDYDYDIWIDGCCESLKGQALSHLGHVDEAMEHFHNALRLLGKDLPQRKSHVHLKVLKEGFKQWLHHVAPLSYFGMAPDHITPRLVEQARCLSHIFHHLLIQDRKEASLMVVLQQINMVEDADTDLHELIIAYTCMMEYCQLMNWFDLGLIYEHKAQIRCMNSTQNIQGLVTMGHFYQTSLTMQLSWGKIEEAIESGYTGDKMLQKVHDNDMRTCLLPYLCQANMLANRVTNAVEVLENLEYITAETEDVVGKAWYFACCMDFILESGFQLESYSHCLVHAMHCNTNPAFQRNRVPIYYLSSCLALWYQRHNVSDKKELWRRVAERSKPAKAKSFMAMHAFCKLLESKLIDLSRCQKEHTHIKMKKLTPDIGTDFLVLEKACKHLVVLKPRFLHYKAYYYMIKNNRAKANKILKNCRNLCRKHQNFMELNWVEHNKAIWNNVRPGSKLKTIWTENGTEDDFVVDWHAAKSKESVVSYALPLPQPKRR